MGFVGVEGHEDVLAQLDTLDVFFGDEQAGNLEACAEVGDDVAFSNEVAVLLIDVLDAAVCGADDGEVGVVLLLLAELGAGVLGIEVEICAEVFEVLLELNEACGGGFVGQAGVVVVDLGHGVGWQEALVSFVVQRVGGLFALGLGDLGFEQKDLGSFVGGVVERIVIVGGGVCDLG